MSPDDLLDMSDNGLDALPAGAVESLRRAVVHTAWCADPAVHLDYDEDVDVLTARIVDLPVARERHVHDHLVVRLDGADESALLVELELDRFTTALRAPAARRARQLLGPTAWRRAVELSLDGTGETAVCLDPGERDVLLARWAAFARPVTVVGVQVLPNALHGVLVDEQGAVLAESTMPLAQPRPDAVAEGVAELLAKLPGPVEGVCLQIGAPVDPSDGVVHSYHKGDASFDIWRDAELGAMVSAATELPVQVMNDVVALAVFERWFGLGASLDRYGVLLVAEGIGGALVRDGVPDPDTPMELGNIVIHPAGLKCRCGSRGCVEATAGAWAIVERVVHDLGHLHIADLDDAVALLERTGDPVLRAVFREAGEDLAVGIGSVQALLDLRAWVVHLPPALAGDADAAMTFRHAMEQFAHSVSYEPYRHSELHIRPATGREGAHGAGLAALEHFGLSSVPEPRSPES